MRRLVLAALGGLTMAAGLAVSGLTDATRIIGFLDFAGRWDPTALFVMVAAAGVFGAGHVVVARRQPRPASNGIDASLFAGAVMFGVGWGLSGLCPGPAFVIAAGAGAKAWTFLAGSIAGAAVYAWTSRLRSGVATASSCG